MLYNTSVRQDLGYCTLFAPATEHHHPLAGTKLYCLVTEAHGCEQLAQSCCLTMQWSGVEPVTSLRCPNYNTIKPPKLALDKKNNAKCTADLKKATHEH